MTKTIKAFFKNENDAEAALAKVQKLKVLNAYIDTVPDEEGSTFVFPINNLGTGGSSMVGTPMVSNKINTLENDDDKEASINNFSHMLEFEVKEDHVKEAIQELRDTEAYFDKQVLSNYLDNEM